MKDWPNQRATLQAVDTWRPTIITCVACIRATQVMRAPERFRQETVIPVLMEMPQVKIRRASQTLKISVVDVETSKLLGVPMNTPVAEVVRVFTGPKDEILYMAEITYKADFIHFEMELKV
jgi:GntR family transcriptional regulator